MHTVLSSATKTVTIGHDLPFVIIGERLNPTGRKLFQEKLRADDLSTINIDVADQVAGGCATTVPSNHASADVYVVVLYKLRYVAVIRLRVNYSLYIILRFQYILFRKT